MRHTTRQAFYWPPGHTPDALEDCEYVDLSPNKGVPPRRRAHQGPDELNSASCVAICRWGTSGKGVCRRTAGGRRVGHRGKVVDRAVPIASVTVRVRDSGAVVAMCEFREAADGRNCSKKTSTSPLAGLTCSPASATQVRRPCTADRNASGTRVQRSVQRGGSPCPGSPAAFGRSAVRCVHVCTGTSSSTGSATDTVAVVRDAQRECRTAPSSSGNDTLRSSTARAGLDRITASQPLARRA